MCDSWAAVSDELDDAKPTLILNRATAPPERHRMRGPSTDMDGSEEQHADMVRRPGRSMGEGVADMVRRMCFSLILPRPFTNMLSLLALPVLCAHQLFHPAVLPLCARRYGEVALLHDMRRLAVFAVRQKLIKVFSRQYKHS